MNLAILLGVSDYAKPISNLAACKNDVTVMKSIIQNSTKFENILVIDTETTSDSIKTKLSEFIQTHKNGSEDIDELFYYYTGHGGFFDDDFYFLPSNFSETKKQQTGLSNTELDAMLRSLEPKLTTKVVDACNSGTTYVKQTEVMKKSLEHSKHVFNKCYFMFSSRKDQYSFQDHFLSDFTKAFAKAIQEHSGTAIRYKDIIDYISDCFAHHEEQTPTFVIQADFLEVFCTISKPLRDGITSFLEAGNELVSDSKSAAPQGSEWSLTALVKKEADRYCSKQECLELLEALASTAKGRPPLSGISELFNYSVTLLDKLSIPNEMDIAKWLTSYKHAYFVSYKYKSENYEDYVPDPFMRAAGLSTALSTLYPGAPGSQKVIRTRKVLTGFEQNSDSSYKAIRIDAKPNFENLSWWTAFIVPVFSKVSMRLFYSFATSTEKDWGDWVMDNNISWQNIEFDMKGDTWKKALENILSAFDKELLGTLNEKFRPQPAPISLQSIEASEDRETTGTRDDKKQLHKRTKSQAEKETA